MMTEIEKMWDEFGDVPINDNDEIEKPFYRWEKGTDRFEIWKWFDNNYPVGVAGLMWK